jgi:hypothetical protein
MKMPTPQATTENSSAKDELINLFNNWGKASFSQSLEGLASLEFYKKVLGRIAAGEDLSDELPELKKLSPTEVIRVVQALIERTDSEVRKAWELKPNISSLFDLTVRQHKDDISQLPCFDIQYQATVVEGLVTVRMTSWRRNLTVEVEADDAAAFVVMKKLVMASMKN